MRVADDPFADIPATSAAVIKFPEPPAYMDEADASYGAKIASKEADDAPLPGCADPADWSGRKAPDRRFIIPGWIVRGSAGLLSGMEGVGKSLIAQQLATSAAIGGKFLGLEIEHVNAVYITCEDSIDELWRRQESINKMLGITMADIAGRLKLVSLVGELNNELGTFDAQGVITPSGRYRQILKTATDFKAGLVVLDNAAHMFSGNENARHDVAAFLGLLERLSQRIDGAALLLAHPNKQHSQGNKQGNEYSGSTGWSAHVRNRLFLDYRTPGDDGMPVDDDERVLRKSKANYGKRGEEITFRWRDWAFVRLEDIEESTAQEIRSITQANGENERFLECLDKATSERRTVSARPAAPNYAPKVFAKMTVAQKMPMASFVAAMERLLHLGQIVGDGPVFKRDNRSWAMGIVRSDGAQSLHKAHRENSDALCKTHNNVSGLETAQSSNDDFAQSAHKAAPSTLHRSALHSTPSTTYVGEPSGGSPPTYDQDDFDPPPWMDEAPPAEPFGDYRDNPIFGDRHDRDRSP